MSLAALSLGGHLLGRSINESNTLWRLDESSAGGSRVAYDADGR
jgi:hypothetical protein